MAQLVIVKNYSTAYSTTLLFLCQNYKHHLTELDGWCQCLVYELTHNLVQHLSARLLILSVKVWFEKTSPAGVMYKMLSYRRETALQGAL